MRMNLWMPCLHGMKRRPVLLTQKRGNAEKNVIKMYGSMICDVYDRLRVGITLFIPHKNLCVSVPLWLLCSNTGSIQNTND